MSELYKCEICGKIGTLVDTNRKMALFWHVNGKFLKTKFDPQKIEFDLDDFNPTYHTLTTAYIDGPDLCRECYDLLTEWYADFLVDISKRFQERRGLHE